MTGPFEGPQNRPDTPEFWRMAEIILQLDGATEDGGDEFEAMIATATDPASLAYMAMQRAMRATGVETRPELARQHRDIVRLASVYHEAFLLGYRYRDRYGKPSV